MVQNANTAPGWGPGVGPTSGASGWSPPVVGPGSSEVLWSSGPQTGSSVLVDQVEVTAVGSKKRSIPSNFEFEDDHENGPSPSKRRMCGEADHEDETEAGYNSEDEYNHFGVQLTEEEWVEKDRKFELTMRKKGYIIKKMHEDGSCLFRAVADQIYGDQEMHVSVRKHCMDYIVSTNKVFWAPKQFFMSQKLSKFATMTLLAALGQISTYLFVFFRPKIVITSHNTSRKTYTSTLPENVIWECMATIWKSRLLVKCTADPFTSIAIAQSLSTSFK